MQSKKTQTGVIYLGHLPHGFFEPQIKNFFAQFGKVVRVKVSRSRQSGSSKGYAFVEFLHDEVAKVVAGTMNNYLMFNRLMKCEYRPADKVHPSTFKGSNRFFFRSKGVLRSATSHNKERSAAQDRTLRRKTKSTLFKKMAMLKEMGIDFDVKELVEDTPADVSTEAVEESSTEVKQTRGKRKQTSQGEAEAEPPKQKAKGKKTTKTTSKPSKKSPAPAKTGKVGKKAKTTVTSKKATTAVASKKGKGGKKARKG